MHNKLKCTHYVCVLAVYDLKNIINREPKSSSDYQYIFGIFKLRNMCQIT